MKKRKVLFVCTGNIFRSMGAEYCLKDYLKKNGIKGYEVSSAGTTAEKGLMQPAVKKTLNGYGIDPSKHVQRRLTKRMLKESDVVIVMAEYHRKFIREKFGYNSTLLFNEISINRHTSVWDDIDKIKNYGSDQKLIDRFGTKTVKYIYKETPKVFKGILDRVFLFEDLVSGRRKQSHNFPFFPFYKSEDVVAFMSIDIPVTEDSHVLVIPRKRYVDFEEVPRKVLNEIMDVAQKIGVVLHKNHDGYNVLLNNGIASEQSVYHVHVHLIPREIGDGVRIEIWKRRNVSKKKFISYVKSLRRDIKKTYKW